MEKNNVQTCKKDCSLNMFDVYGPLLKSQYQTEE